MIPEPKSVQAEPAPCSLCGKVGTVYPCVECGRAACWGCCGEQLWSMDFRPSEEAGGLAEVYADACAPCLKVIDDEDKADAKLSGQRMAEGGQAISWGDAVAALE